jgi:hypothetical protein
MKDVANIPRLTLAYYELLAIVKRQEPPMASKHAHFSNLVNIHQSVAMNPAE